MPSSTPASTATRPEGEGGPRLRRSLTAFDATLLNVGTMLGSGIFLTPAAIAAGLAASGLHLVVWVAGGLFSVLGALTLSELGAMMPEAGGIYVYLERAYGRIWGFLYGWALFLAIQCGSIAAISVAAATYLGYFVPLGTAGTRMVAVAIVLGLTWVNARGVRQGAFTQNLLTTAKIGAVGLLVAVSLRSADVANLDPILPSGPALPLLAPLGLALVAALWCYDGWIHTCYVAGELRNPGRSLPLAAILSTLVVIVLYAGLNLAFLLVLGVDRMAQSSLVASDMARAAIGPLGGGLVAALVALSCIGAGNGFILAGARVYYAMARDGLFFRAVARLDPERSTPKASLILQSIWSSVLVFSGRYDQIFTYVIFVEFVFYGMAAGAVLILRRREPEAMRPYRVPGYPWIPWLFILFSAALTLNTLWSSPREAAIGAVVMITGIPAYLYWRRRAA